MHQVVAVASSVLPTILAAALEAEASVPTRPTRQIPLDLVPVIPVVEFSALVTTITTMPTLHLVLGAPMLEGVFLEADLERRRALAQARIPMQVALGLAAGSVNHLSRIRVLGDSHFQLLLRKKARTIQIITSRSPSSSPTLVGLLKS